MTTTYKTKGVCAKTIIIEIQGDKILSVTFVGGCDGNAKGVSKLVEGMNVDEVISRLQGIKCGYKSTSCPDQLAMALQTIKESESSEA